MRPLFGPHLVSIFEIPSHPTEGVEIQPVMRTFWVHSLTDLRRNMFCFRDRLSFERSTYLIPYSDGQLLIRLKSIRAFLKLPILLENTTTPVAASVPQYVDEEEEEEDEPERSMSVAASASPSDHEILRQDRSLKMRTLLNHHVQVMISYLNRELHQNSATSISMLQSYVHRYCQELYDQIRNN